jgi:hypothetical protein
MRKETSKVPDDAQAAARRKLFLRILPVVGIILFLGTWFFPVSFKSVRGITESFSAGPDEKGSRPQVTVRLESGAWVVANFPRQLDYRRGAKVVVVERQVLLGKRSYQVVRYAE